MAIPTILVINGELFKPFPAGTGLQVVNGELRIMEEEAAIIYPYHSGMGGGIESFTGGMTT